MVGSFSGRAFGVGVVKFHHHRENGSLPAKRHSLYEGFEPDKWMILEGESCNFVLERASIEWI
jgi:hypothetical protein